MILDLTVFVLSTNVLKHVLSYGTVVKLRLGVPSLAPGNWSHVIFAWLSKTRRLKVKHKGTTHILLLENAA